MSRENVRQVLAAWRSRNLDGMLALIDSDAEYVNAPDAVEPGTRRGHAGLEAVARRQWAMPGAQIEIERLIDRGDEVVAVGSVTRQMPGSDTRMGNPVVVLWALRDGKVTRIEMLGAGPRFREALEAAGLRE